MIRVLVVDDQAIVRDGLVTVLSLVDGFDVVGEAADGLSAVALADTLKPDVVLMDLRMPVTAVTDLDGVGATERIAAAQPTTAVLVLTTYADDDSILRALRAGARGYITKDAGRVQLEAAIRSVASGQSAFAADVSAKLVGRLTTDLPVAERFPTLTRREVEILELIVTGLNNPEIAERLFISVTTVKTHVNSIFAKLGARDRAQAITIARSPGSIAR